MSWVGTFIKSTMPEIIASIQLLFFW